MANDPISFAIPKGEMEATYYYVSLVWKETI
nr:hypothetical protein [Leptospira wolbachii]